MYIKDADRLSDYDQALLVDILLNQENDFVANIQGDLDATFGLLNVKEALYRRITTAKGSLFWAPQYGTRLLELLNESSTQGNLDIIEMQVRAAIDQENRIEKNATVEVAFDELNGGVLNIKIACELVGSKIPEELNYEVFIQGSR